MKIAPDTLFVFLLTSVFVLILLFVFLVFLPRLLKKEEAKKESAEINTIVNAFRALGDEIKSLKQQLVIKERLAALGEVSAGIAHEFRNPMGVIAGYAKLLLKSLDENDPRREIVQGIFNEIEDMNRVMEELLKFSKSEPIKKIDINLTKSIKDVIESMADSADKIDFGLLDDVSIKGDETLLKQAIKNLVHNAIEAGDRVWIEVRRQKSEDRGQKEGACIIVKDNGKGIPDEDFNRIFMPFYTTKDKGAGIGLALVQKIVTEHGGNISVESREGEGSTFRVFLPIE